MTPDLQREVESFASTYCAAISATAMWNFLFPPLNPILCGWAEGKPMQAEGAEEVARFFRVGAENMLTCRMWDERYVTRELAPGRLPVRGHQPPGIRSPRHPR